MRLAVCCVAIATSAVHAEEARKGVDAVAPRIAVMPSFSDVGTPDGWRPWASGFDAALQSELLQGWDVTITSRAGLSTVVFDQKLAFAKGERKAPPVIRAADFSVFLVLDARASEVRVHVTPVAVGMKIGEPVKHAFRDAAHYGTMLPKDVAKDIARRIGLRPRGEKTEPAAEADSGTPKQEPLKIAIVPPFSNIEPEHFTEAMATLFGAMLEEGCLALKQPVELVERTEMARLLDERELLAGNATGAGLDANSAADIARLAGARIILLPYLHPANNHSARVTIHAIDSETGEIAAARSWTGKVSEPPPVAALGELLAEAGRQRPGTGNETAASRNLRHAEADHLVGLYDTMTHTHSGFREKTLLSLILADAALALAYDDTERYSKVIGRFLERALPWKLSATLAWADSDFDRAYKRAKEDGSLAEITRQARRVFELPIRELRDSRGNNTDIQNQSRFLLASGDAQAALDHLLAIDGGVEGIARIPAFTITYGRALIELGRIDEAVKFLTARYERYKTDSETIFLLLDARRLEGDVRNEIGLMYHEHKWLLKSFSTNRLARFLEIAVNHDRPDRCLRGFHFCADPWRRNELPVIEQLVRLRISLKQKQRASDDAQCGYLLAKLEGKPEFTQTFKKLLDELGAKPLDTLPKAAAFIKLPADSRFDLFHDSTIPPERAAKIGRLIADFWNCEVHVMAAPVDASKLEAFDHASQRIVATDLANHMFPLIRPGDGLLQTVFLTARPLRTSLGAIYGTTSHHSAVQFVSTYYFDYFAGEKKKVPSAPAPTLDEMVAIASVQRGSMAAAISDHIFKITEKYETFRPLPPDALANSGKLTLEDRLLGVSLHTARILAEIKPEAFRERANNGRDKLLEQMAGDKSPDTAAFRQIAALISKTKPLIIKPDPENK